MRDWRGFWLLVIIGLIYGVFEWIVPFCLDDFMYINRWNYATDHEHFGIDAWVKFIKHNRAVDNFRIGNMLAPFAVYFQSTQLLFPIFTGGCVSAIVYIIKRLVAGMDTSENSFLYSTIWISMVLCLPWGNLLFIADFALNYIWAAAINLWALWLLFKALETKPGKWRLLSLLFLSFIAGGWHEGFALPTLCGLAMLALVRKGRLSAVFFLFFYCLLAVGSILFMVARHVGKNR